MTFYKERTVVASTTETITLDPFRDVTIVCHGTPGSQATFKYAIKDSPLDEDFFSEVVSQDGSFSLAFVGKGLTAVRLEVALGTYIFQVRQSPYAIRRN